MKQLMKKGRQGAYVEGQKKQVRGGRLYELKMFSKHIDMLEQLDLLVENPKPGRDKVLWQEPSFSGEATYYTTGPLAKSESAAIEETLKDLAQRVVERTVQSW